MHTLLHRKSTPMKSAIDTLRDKAEGLDPQFALVGYFGPSLREDKVIPLSDLTVCCLIRNPRERTYSGRKRNKPAMLACVPGIYDPVEGQVHIGGPNWYWIQKNRKRIYVRERQTHQGVEVTRPVGVLRDIFENTPHHPMELDPERSLMNKQLVEYADEMLSASADTDPCYNVWGDTSPTPPRFLSPITPHTYMKLRMGAALDEQVLHCAETGEWGIRELYPLVAPDNGYLKGTSGNSVELWVPLEGITEAELLEARERAGITTIPDYRVEENHQVFTYKNPTFKVEKEIYQVFGVNVCPVYRPVVQPGETIAIRANRAMFVPVPKKRYTIAELKKRSDYEALCYAAALHDMYDVNGVEMLDLSYAFNPTREPWVDLEGVSPIQRIKYSRSSTVKRYTDANNLACKGDAYNIDLLHISLRVEMRKNAMIRHAQLAAEKRAAAKAAQGAKVG